MKVNINNKEYIDKVNLSNDEFYQLLESSKDFPKTSQPAPLDFIKCFKEAKRMDLFCQYAVAAAAEAIQSGIAGKFACRRQSCRQRKSRCSGFKRNRRY